MFCILAIETNKWTEQTKDDHQAAHCKCCTALVQPLHLIFILLFKLQVLVLHLYSTKQQYFQYISHVLLI